MFFVIIAIITIIAILAFLLLASYSLLLVKKYGYLSRRAKILSIFFSIISFFTIVTILVLLFSLR